jgi:curved DNA-binding protein CbpA
VIGDGDLYAVLEVAPHACSAVIDAAFAVLREAAAKDPDDRAVARLVALNRAHAVLADPDRRARYDLEHRDQRA